MKFAINPEPIFKYDPEKAKFHLKKAGLTTLKVDLSVAGAAFAGAVDAATLYKDHAQAAGIDINVVRESDDAYWDNCLAEESLVRRLLERSSDHATGC